MTIFLYSYQIREKSIEVKKNDNKMTEQTQSEPNAKKENKYLWLAEISFRKESNV